MTARSTSLVLYGVSSPVVVDIEESARRAGLHIAAAIHNVPDAPRVLDRTRLLRHTDVPPSLRSEPFLVPLFSPENRRTALAEAVAAGFLAPANLIDPTSIVPASLTLGTGIYVNTGCTIGAASRFEDFVFVNRSASIGHHVVLERFVSIGPGVVLSGMVTVGEAAVIGAGAVVLPGITIGAHARVAPGAIVTRDVPPETVAAGRPMRLLSRSSRLRTRSG